MRFSFRVDTEAPLMAASLATFVGSIVCMRSGHLWATERPDWRLLGVEEWVGFYAQVPSAYVVGTYGSMFVASPEQAFVSERFLPDVVLATALQVASRSIDEGLRVAEIQSGSISGVIEDIIDWLFDALERVGSALDDDRYLKRDELAYLGKRMRGMISGDDPFACGLVTVGSLSLVESLRRMRATRLSVVKIEGVRR